MGYRFTHMLDIMLYINYYIAFWNMHMKELGLPWLRTEDFFLKAVSMKSIHYLEYSFSDKSLW